MGWRFRKSVKVFPGFRLNFGKRGISTTVGVRGLNVNVGSRGTYLNTGIPGTGLSYRTKLSGNSNQPSAQKQSYNNSTPQQSFTPQQPVYVPDDDFGAIKSADTSHLTSSSLQALKGTLQDAFIESQTLQNEIHLAGQNWGQKQQKLDKLRKGWFSRYFSKGKIAQLEVEVQEEQEKYAELNEQLQLCSVKLENMFDDVSFAESYKRVVAAFQELSTCEQIWDVTKSLGVDLREKSMATSQVNRKPVQFYLRNIGIIQSDQPAFHLMNDNGGDIFIYPGFVLVIEHTQKFAVIDYKELDVSLEDTRFVEEQGIPRDTEVIGQTWKKVNKNGSPDRRFADNYQIPIARYGTLKISSKQGLNEEYLFSSYAKLEKFVNAFSAYYSQVIKASP